MDRHCEERSNLIIETKKLIMRLLHRIDYL